MNKKKINNMPLFTKYNLFPSSCQLNFINFEFIISYNLSLYFSINFYIYSITIFNNT